MADSRPNGMRPPTGLRPVVRHPARKSTARTVPARQTALRANGDYNGLLATGAYRLRQTAVLCP